MTQEEKTRRYDEAFERAKKELDACGSQDCDAARQIFRLFPELAESEDEKIRKALLEYFNEQCDMSDWNGIYGYQVVDWLEKQASPVLSNSSNIGKNELNPCSNSWSEEDEVKINRIVACLENLNVADNDILLKDVDWLKSLKDRVQPTIAWNENDEVALESAATNYAQDKYLPVQTAQAFKAGAEWMKKRIKTTLNR